MPLGDSITGSPGCWRALLWNRLQSTGYTNIDFVGTLGPQGCGVPYDGDNEGHGGFLATNVADQNQLVRLARRDPARHRDHALRHQRRLEQPADRDDPGRVQQAGRPDAGQQPDHEDPGRARSSRWPRRAAARVPGPRGRPQQRDPGLGRLEDHGQSPITVVDQWTGFSTATDTYDGVHPNAAGDQKISDRWYPALAAALGTTTPPVDTQAPTTPGHADRLVHLHARSRSVGHRRPTMSGSSATTSSAPPGPAAAPSCRSARRRRPRSPTPA